MGRDRKKCRTDRGSFIDSREFETVITRTYPNIEALLKILATLPVTTCTAERSFNALKHLKSYLRSTMTEKRLNRLAALYIHKDIALNKEAVIDEFSRGNRRMKFV